MIPLLWRVQFRPGLQYPAGRYAHTLCLWGPRVRALRHSRGEVMTSASLLESVAEHEQTLMTRVQEAEARAQAILEKAHADAAAHAAQERARTEEEMATRRRD